MSFGEHLEELRRSLGKAVIWLGIGLGVGLIFANQVVKFVQDPLREAILEFEAKRTLERYGYDATKPSTSVLRDFLIDHELIVEQVLVVPMSEASAAETPAGTAPPPALESAATAGAVALEAAETKKATTQATPPSADAKQPAGSEQPAGEKQAAGEKTAADAGQPAGEERPGDGGEARSPGAGGPESPVLFEDLNAEQMQELIPDLGSFRRQFQLRPSKAGLNSHKTEEGFMIWIKAGLLVGAVLASPMIFYHIWTFVGAGLYSHERKYVYVYLPFSVTLFVSGVCLAFFLVLHYVLNFLLDFNAGMDVSFQPRLSYYMNFVLLLPLGFGIAFQLPLVMLFLQRIGIFETKAYIDSWRIAVLVICVLSMILTPADITSMVALAVPLCLLYGLGILMCQYIPRGRGLGSQALDPS